jgi:hypothetical protein
MNRLLLIQRVRNLTRDLSNAIFREIDIIDYINESIDRIKQVMPELIGMSHLTSNEDVPAFLPAHYHHLIAVYATSRCFGQDERHYQATNFMNEFETKIDDLKNEISNGQVVIVDGQGKPVIVQYASNYVNDNYFASRKGIIDLDNGVEGLE